MHRLLFYSLARDHFLWPDCADLIVVDHEVFKERVSSAGSLLDLVSGLRTYDWLPVENRDFFVTFAARTANGVTAESEVFYRTASVCSGRNQPNLRS